MKKIEKTDRTDEKEKSSNWKYVLPILVLTVIMFLIYTPQYIQQGQAKEFARPLFTHALPEGTKSVQGNAGKDGEGGVIAAVLLQTDLTSEEVLEFYSDTEYAPIKEGYDVVLKTKEVDEASIEAMKQAEVYEEGKHYLFIYIQSSPQQ